MTRGTEVTFSSLLVTAATRKLNLVVILAFATILFAGCLASDLVATIEVSPVSMQVEARKTVDLRVRTSESLRIEIRDPDENERISLHVSVNGSSIYVKNSAPRRVQIGDPYFASLLAVHEAGIDTAVVLVRADDAAGHSAQTRIAVYVYDTTPPPPTPGDPPTLTFPGQDAVVTQSSVWKFPGFAFEGQSSTEIQWSTSPSFDDGETILVTNQSYVQPDELPLGTVYWRGRSVKQGTGVLASSEWSEVRRIHLRAPDAPSGLSDLRWIRDVTQSSEGGFLLVADAGASTVVRGLDAEFSEVWNVHLSAATDPSSSQPRGIKMPDGDYVVAYNRESWPYARLGRWSPSGELRWDIALSEQNGSLKTRIVGYDGAGSIWVGMSNNRLIHVGRDTIPSEAYEVPFSIRELVYDPYDGLLAFAGDQDGEIVSGRFYGSGDVVALRTLHAFENPEPSSIRCDVTGTGATYLAATVGGDALVAKTDYQARLIWEHTIDAENLGFDDTGVLDLHVASDGSVWVAGYGRRDGSPRTLTGLVLRFDAAGTLVWTRSVIVGHGTAASTVFDRGDQLGITGFTRSDYPPGDYWSPSTLVTSQFDSEGRYYPLIQTGEAR